MINARPGGFRLFALVSLVLLAAACGQDSGDDDGTATGPEVETLAGIGSTSTADALAVQTSGSFGTGATSADGVADDGADAEASAGTTGAMAATGDDPSAAGAVSGASTTSAPGSSSTGSGSVSSSTPSPSSTSAPGVPAPSSTAPSNPTSTVTTATPSTTAAPTTNPTTTTAAPTTAAPTTAANQVRCLVRLHGKGGSGRATGSYGDGIRQVRPQGNSQAWGGHQWLYFPESGYNETVSIVTAAVNAEGCTDVVLNGFSNGAAFAAKMYCRGESFGGRLRGVVIDDPVPDHGTANCSPAGGVQRVLYWTGDLANAAPAGTDCARIDWTCDGGSSVGIDSYAQRLGASITPSPFSDHQWYWDAPQVTSFFG